MFCLINDYLTGLVHVLVCLINDYLSSLSHVLFCFIYDLEVFSMSMLSHQCLRRLVNVLFVSSVDNKFYPIMCHFAWSK